MGRQKDVDFDVVPGECVLGLDPGRSGGIAFLTKDGKAAAWGMTKMERKDVSRLIEYLSSFQPRAFLEKVSSRPLQSSRATFTFGQEYERLYMGTTCFNIETELVSPFTWQKYLNCPKKPNDKSLKPHEKKRIHKNRLKKIAEDLFPDLKITLQTADALLIAQFGRLTYLLRSKNDSVSSSG